jgi:hypothetical protein
MSANQTQCPGQGVGICRLDAMMTAELASDQTAVAMAMEMAW